MGMAHQHDTIPIFSIFLVRPGWSPSCNGANVIINFTAWFAVVVMLVVPTGAVARLLFLLLFSNDFSFSYYIFSFLLFVVVSYSACLPLIPIPLVLVFRHDFDGEGGGCGCMLRRTGRCGIGSIHHVFCDIMIYSAFDIDEVKQRFHALAHSLEPLRNPAVGR